MADGVSITIRKKDRLFRKMRQSVATLKDETEQAAFASAQEMAGAAQARAPFDDGDLRASIVATPAGQSTPSYSHPGGSTAVPDGAALVTAGNSRVRYAHLVEYGTSSHVQGGLFAGTIHPGTARQPFFWISYRLMRRRIKNRMTRAVNRAFKRAAK